MAGPCIPDIASLVAAGIDPKTGLPLKVTSSIPSALKANIKAQLRVIDEQDAVNRYIWHGLPYGLNSNLIERILYYRGQGMFFYMETEAKFYFLPYALDGEIDVYGRFTGVTPVPLGSTANEENDKGKVRPWIKGLTFKPLYDVVMPDDDNAYDYITKGCVLLSDYSKQISQTVIPRAMLNDPILDVMSECIPYMRTALRNSTGIEGMRVNSEDESSNVGAASLAIQNAALNGEKWVPIVGSVEFQQLTNAQPAKVEEYLLALQALDNYRLSVYGLDNGGLFQKKSHMLEAEQRMNTTNSGIVMDDGLQRRLEAADIFNSIFGTAIYPEVNETLNNLTMLNGMTGDLAGEEATEENE